MIAAAGVTEVGCRVVRQGRQLELQKDTARSAFALACPLVNGIDVMPIQTARFANLRRIIDALEQRGFLCRQSQANFLGTAASARALQSMLDGVPIPLLFAEHVEHLLSKPRGWMSQHHDDLNDPIL